MGDHVAFRNEKSRTRIVNSVLVFNVRIKPPGQGMAAHMVDQGNATRHSNGRPQWSAELTNTLRELWATWTAGELCKLMGLTRSAVIGKANRLKLGPKKPTGGRPPRPPRPPPLVVYVEPPPTIIELPFRNLTICEIKSGECHYPHGGEGTAITFCGQLVQAGSSYCPHHHRIACHPVSPVRRDLALDVGHWRGMR